MTANFFKKYVKTRFGSVQRFLILTRTNLNEYDRAIRASTKSDSLLKELHRRGELIKAVHVKGQDLSQDLIKKIRDKIYTDHKNASQFSKKHPKYGDTWLSALINGNFKRQSKKVKSLMKTLKIIE